LYPFLLKLYADGGYQGPEFRLAMRNILGQINVEIIKRSDQAKSFVVLPKRWVVVGCTKLPACTLSGWNGSSGFNCGQNFTMPQPH
jgi:transposase